MRRRTIIIAIVILGTAYLGGYAFARHKHYLVHYDSCGTHTVRMGDVGFDFMNPHYDFACISYYTFAPLRWLESFVWDLKG